MTAAMSAKRRTIAKAATMSAKDATMSAKGATMSAKDATMSAKDAIKNRKDASMTPVWPLRARPWAPMA